MADSKSAEHSQTTILPPPKLDWSQRRLSYCQAWEDGCEYKRCPRWRDGKIIDEAHCALDLMGIYDE